MEDFKNEYNEVWINLGCGIRLIKNFINVDSAFNYEDLVTKQQPFDYAEIDEGILSFVRADMRKLPFPDDYADYIMSVYAIEHLPIKDVIPSLMEWKRVLKPDGYLNFVTVNFDGIAQLWTAAIAEQAEFNVEHYWDIASTIYGNQVTAGEFHCCPFNAQATTFFLSNAGFAYWEMSLFPRGFPANVSPKGYPGPEGRVMAFSEIHVKAYKNVPAHAKASIEGKE